MKTQSRFSCSKSMRLKRTPFFAFALLLVCAGAICGSAVLRAQSQAAAKSPSRNQATFSSPEEAMQAMISAAKTKDHAAIAKILGPENEQVYSGDPVEDDKDLAGFADAAGESASLRKDDENKYTILVGKDKWPAPIPIVKQGNEWVFDTKAGLDEILNRRIGENELSAITTCRTYVLAQWEYFTEADNTNHPGLNVYAQKFMSSPGMHDGLYWDTSEGEKSSPLGKLVADARAEGYTPGSHAMDESGAKHVRSPYHGYFFKILNRQGAHVPGGKFNYIINGNMIAGYALIAYPAKWGNSGVMTFIVNQQGRVYEKNLGLDTEKIASGITEYDPDRTWKLVAK
jgi:hypothetical protein